MMILRVAVLRVMGPTSRMRMGQIGYAFVCGIRRRKVGTRRPDPGQMPCSGTRRLMVARARDWFNQRTEDDQSEAKRDEPGRLARRTRVFRWIGSADVLRIAAPSQKGRHHRDSAWGRSGGCRADWSDASLAAGRAAMGDPAKGSQRRFFLHMAESRQDAWERLLPAGHAGGGLSAAASGDSGLRAARSAGHCARPAREESGPDAGDRPYWKREIDHAGGDDRTPEPQSRV